MAFLEEMESSGHWNKRQAQAQTQDRDQEREREQSWMPQLGTTFKVVLVLSYCLTFIELIYCLTLIELVQSNTG
jgi:hypothetical protein